MSLDGLLAERARRQSDVPDPAEFFQPTTPLQERRQRFGRSEPTTLGRIGGALTEPFKETRFGIPEEAAAIFQSPNQAVDVLNDLVVKGVASPVFAGIQAFGAGAEGVIDALVQTVVETGVIDPGTGGRASRDLKGLLESAPAFGGQVPSAVARAGGVTQEAGGVATQVRAAAAPAVEAARQRAPVQTVARQVENFSTARKAGKSAPKAEVRAFRTLRKALTKDLGNKGRAEAALRKWVADGADPDALIDLGGENMKRLARALASEEPEKALNLINKFRESQAPAIRGALSRAANEKGLVGDDVLDDIKFIKQTKGGELYSKAHTIEISTDIYRNELRTFVQEQIPKSAINDAIKIARADGDFDTVQLLTLASKGEETTLTVKALDFIKRGVDDAVGSALKSDQKKSFGTALNNSKKEWLAKIDKVVPEFKEARDFYAGQFDTEEALKLGREFTKGSKNAGQVRRELEALNPSEQEFYRLGVADALEDVISRTRDVSNKATFVKTDAMRQKIRALLETDPESADEFIDFLQTSSRRFERRTAISPQTGSQTEERFRGAQALRSALSPRETAIKGVEAFEARRAKKVTDILAEAFFVGRPLQIPPAKTATGQ